MYCVSFIIKRRAIEQFNRGQGEFLEKIEEKDREINEKAEKFELGRAAYVFLVFFLM
jgi:hypothetical protein